MSNYDGYIETQIQADRREWKVAMQSVGCMRDFRPLNTEAEADAIYAFIQAAEAGDKKTDFNTASNLSAQNWLNKNVDFDTLYKSTTERSNALKARIDARMAKAYSIKRGGNG